MRHYVSPFLKSVAVCYMAFPLLYLVLAGVIFDVSLKSLMSFLLSPVYFLLSALCVAAGYGLWNFRRWSWYVFLAGNFLMIYWNALVVTQYGTTQHPVLGFFLWAVLLFVLLSRVSREVRVPYLLPRIRWWETNPRYRLIVPVRVVRKTEAPETSEAPEEKASSLAERAQKADQVVAGEILDLTAAGAFIKLRERFASDELVVLSFEIFGLELSVEGHVVWQTLGAVTHPQGVGVKFGAMSRHTRRALRLVEQRLRKIQQFYRSNRYLMNQEEFSRRMEELSKAVLTMPGTGSDSSSGMADESKTS